MFQGNTLSLKALDDGYVELHFNALKGSVNVFNQATLAELNEALSILERQGAKGLLLTSGKAVFVAGADITEFDTVFSAPKAEMKAFLTPGNQAFNRIESLPFPSVVAINGFALGGGFEICLACDYRVMSTVAQVGVPETKLGLIPGWGGTVRLPRLIGFDNAVEWVAGGGQYKSPKALAAGAVDAIVEPELLREEALKMLALCDTGALEYQSRRQQKQSPLQLNEIEMGMSASTCKAQVAAKAGRNYPAPVVGVDTMIAAAGMGRDEALEVEFQGFYTLSQTPQCRAMVGMFLSDQYIAGVAKKYASQTDKKIKHVTAMGAGIMGGGISYQNAYKGFPVLMKDISVESLSLGMSEANKLLSRRVERKQLTPLKSGSILSQITPSLSYEGVENTDIVIEAVVENVTVKGLVLAEVEQKVGDEAILVSNTSTISIDQLARKLKRPENFCGMHFFNPVHAMPLVEVIRGSKTSDATVAAVVAHSLAMGKKPIVVNNCPGFFVNRVLFPTVFAFDMMVVDGADFQQVDRVVQNWGWPMGPAYLMDVVGIDTSVHCFPIMHKGYPARMKKYGVSPTKLMCEHERLGQKNGKGFYSYEADKRGKPTKVVDPDTYEILAPHVKPRREFGDDEIIARFMIPICIEMAHCLEEGIVSSPAEADMAVVYGLGFPPFRGGVFRWMDELGLDKFCEMADCYREYGELYKVTARMREMATSGERYYG